MYNYILKVSIYHSKEEEVAEYLVQKGASVNANGMGDRSTAHVAAWEGMCSMLKIVLEKGCSPNKQACRIKEIY